MKPIGRIVGLGKGYCALGSVFCPCCWALLVDPLFLCVTVHPDIFSLLGTLSRAGLP